MGKIYSLLHQFHNISSEIIHRHDIEQMYYYYCICSVFICIHSRSTFQAWLEAVVPQMARLNVEQTKTLFAALIKQCPAHQRVFLEQDLRYLFAKDFMTLPSLVVDNILSYLDVESLLTLRLVSWAGLTIHHQTVYHQTVHHQTVHYKTVHKTVHHLTFHHQTVHHKTVHKTVHCQTVHHQTVHQ